MNKNCPYCNKEFNSWKSIRVHTGHCNKNTGEYYTDIDEGPIHYTEFYGTFRNIKHKFPNLKTSITDIKKNFKKRGIILDISYQNYSKEEIAKFIRLFKEKENKIPTRKDWSSNLKYPSADYVIKLFGSWNKAIEATGFITNYRSPQNYTKKEIINYIKLFYEKNNKIPTVKDWQNNLEYPTSEYVVKIFSSWNNAIEAAGFIPNINSQYGTRTIAKDGILYRSLAETYFVNNFLYEKEKYFYEIKYPEPYNKYYDFYLPERNLYIEIDGGLRPQVIQEKIEINKKLGRNLLVIPTKDITKFKEFICL
jgi:hypothetical protein